jgi:hypothetical protein
MSEATTSKSKTFYAQRKTTRTREKNFGAAETEPKAPTAGNGGRKHERSEGRNRRWAAHEDYRAGLLDTYPAEIEEIQAHRSRTRYGQESSTHLACSTAGEKQIGT